MTFKTILKSILRWFDSSSKTELLGVSRGPKKVDWVRIFPFLFLHVACLGVLWVGWSPAAVITAAALYVFRIFAITGFYHRYFSHKTFRTSRAAQFIFAVWGHTSVQRGALWWAAHHRNHHKFSDQPLDVHSPRQHGFWWSQMGWITDRENFPTAYNLIPDLARYPKLVFLNRFDSLVPFLFAVSIYIFGAILQAVRPEWGTSGPQMLIWGFFISTVVVFHATGTINSLSHRFGRQRFKTGDDSRNNPLLALLTFGEGWHNNHHKYPSTPRQGFYWWEIDLTYYGLKVLAWMRIIWDLKPIPPWVYEETVKKVELRRLELVNDTAG